MAARVRWTVLYVAAWMPLVLVYTVLIGAGNDLPVPQAVFAALRTIGVAAALGLAATWWTWLTGFPTDAPSRATRRHVIGALAFTIAWAGLVLLGIRGDMVSWDALYAAVRPWIWWQLFFGLVVYAVIAGVLLAIEGARRARLQERRVASAEAERVRAELAALRGQLDPHFLFNTLHTVGALVRRDPAAAEAAVERLAELLRYVLDGRRGARETVPLDDELAFVDAYLALEAMRLGDRLHVTTEIDDDVRDAPVPSLLLQPLIENAIRHGLAPSPRGGTLAVRARRDGPAIALEVADDGVGASPDDAPRGTGVGLEALRRRLAARYGDAASCVVRTAPGAGFTVQLRLPA